MKTSAEIATYRLKSMANQESLTENIIEKEVLHTLVSDFEMFDKIATDIENLFALSNTEIGEEQLLRFIADLRNVFKCCDSTAEKIERIKILREISCFKESKPLNN